MKLLKTILALMMIVVMATSCSSDDAPNIDDSYMELEYDGCFNYIYKGSTNNGVISTGTSYKFRWNADNTADVHIYNAKFSSHMPDGINISFEGLRWEFVDGIKKIDINDIVPTTVTMRGESVDVSSYLIDNLTLEVFERRLLNFTPEYIPIINMSITMGDVEVVTVQKQVVYFGQTDVTNVASGTMFGQDASIYKVTLNPDNMMVTIEIYKAKFDNGMPAQDMKFNGIVFDVSKNGYTLECEELIPTIKAVPYPDYKVTNLKGNATFAKGLDLQFGCKGVFSVNAELGYPME